MAKDIRVLLVDDHQVVRDGLERLLRQEDDIEVVGQGADATEAMAQLEKLSPDVVLMDIKMPNVDGVTLTQQVKQKYPSCNVIMLTLYDEYLSEAMEAGARGYLLKDVRRAELTQAIRQVHSGKVVISQNIKSTRKSDPGETREGRMPPRDNVFEQTIQVLAATAEMKDPYTASHQRRVAQLATAIATEMGLSETVIEGLRLAALVHDIGKTQVPVEILTNTRKLTEPEISIIRTHPTVGYDILKQIDFPRPVARIVYQHHERLNGSGYPNGVSGHDIILEALVLAVADVVEAMSSFRPYRPAIPGLEKALQEIFEKKGILYDSSAVDACLTLCRKEDFSFA
jgi:putative nucleotidyltransferase with HDIG domain